MELERANPVRAEAGPHLAVGSLNDRGSHPPGCLEPVEHFHVVAQIDLDERNVVLAQGSLGGVALHTIRLRVDRHRTLARVVSVSHGSRPCTYSLGTGGSDRPLVDNELAIEKRYNVREREKERERRERREREREGREREKGETVPRFN